MKAQLKFRQKVLIGLIQPVSGKSLYVYYFSKQKKRLTSEQLYANLMTIIAEGDVRAQQINHQNELTYLVSQMI